MPRILLCILAIFIAASQLRADLPTTPGFYLGLSIPGHDKQTFDLLLPPAITDAKPNSLPVVFVLSPTGKTNSWVTNLDFDDVANKKGYIVIGVGDNFTGMALPAYFRQRVEDFENYLTLADSIPQAHKQFRFVLDLGASEGGCAWALAVRYPDKIAGFIMGPGPVNTMAALPKHIVVAALNISHDVPIDEVTHVNISSHASSKTVQTAIVSKQFARGGIAVLDYQVDTLFVRPKYVDPAIEWMIGAATLLNPGLPDEVRAAARDELPKQINDAKAIEKPDARRLALERILALPILKLEEKRDLQATWRTAAVEAANTRVDSTSRGLYLSELANDDRLAGTPEVLAVRKDLSELMKDPIVRNEVLAQQLLARVWAMPERANARPSSGDVTYKQRMIAALNYMISQFPSTRAADTARDRIRDLERETAPITIRQRPATNRPANIR